MGCEATKEVKEQPKDQQQQDQQPQFDEDGNPIDAAPSKRAVPRVPHTSWYFTDRLDKAEQSDQKMTEFHKASRGSILFAPTVIPTQREVDEISDGIRRVPDSFIVGIDPVYGLAYLHESALFVEHYWRGRVKHANATGGFQGALEKPFGNTFIGYKVYVNDQLVPDKFPLAESLPQCTATLHYSDAMWAWRVVPVPLLPDPGHFLLNSTIIYAGLIYSFTGHVANLPAGEHAVRVEVCYGCRAENLHCTDFLAKGELSIVLTEDTKQHVRETNLSLKRLLTSGQIKDPLPNVRLMAAPTGQKCNNCFDDMKYVCTACNAVVCGNQRCIGKQVEGYPIPCKRHFPPNYTEL